MLPKNRASAPGNVRMENEILASAPFRSNWFRSALSYLRSIRPGFIASQSGRWDYPSHHYGYPQPFRPPYVHPHESS